MMQNYGCIAEESAMQLQELADRMILDLGTQFTPTSFPGVVRVDVDKKYIPVEILHEVRLRRCEICEVFLIVASQEVPRHDHGNMGEVYFGGEVNAIVESDRGDQCVEEMYMGFDLFVIANIGERHGLRFCPGIKSSRLWGAKFRPIKRG
jgi:hypothetical protein